MKPARTYAPFALASATATAVFAAAQEPVRSDPVEAARPGRDERITTSMKHHLAMGPDPDHGNDAYVPTVPKEYVDQIRMWHERAYAEAVADAGTDQVFEYLGITLTVPPDVMPITPMSHHLGEAVLTEVQEGERVLDMGTGSGVNAILAATKGAQVLAVDINPRAVEAARANAERNGVADRVEVRASDVFSEVEGRFDVIVFDPPFRWFRPRSLLEAAMTDEGYRGMTTFFRDARQHLAEGGRMLVFFGTSGDLGYLQSRFGEEGFSTEIVAHDQLEREGWGVEYFTFRVT